MLNSGGVEGDHFSKRAPRDAERAEVDAEELWEARSRLYRHRFSRPNHGLNDGSSFERGLRKAEKMRYLMIFDLKKKTRA